MEDKYLKEHQAKIQKHLSEMTPQRRKAIEEAFSNVSATFDPPDPPMRQMSFGGEYYFDQNRRQVELHGEFSKEDLFRIALTLID